MDKDIYKRNVRAAELACYAPIESRITNDAVVGWVNLITTRPDVVERFGRRRIRLRFDKPRARFEAISERTASEITFYPKGRTMRVILHELSHQYCDREHGIEIPAHSAQYADTHVQLAEVVLGTRFATNLHKSYKRSGIPL